jgi:hypothetical protein
MCKYTYFHVNIKFERDNMNVKRTYSIDETVVKKFSEYCDERGLNMSKQIETFMKYVVEGPEVRPEYLEKLEKIRKGEFIPVKDFAKHYGLK